MPPPGDSDRDLLMELRGDIKHILKVLEGNGQEGLCKTVDRMDTTLTKHDVYFALVGSALAIIAACVVERFIG